MLSNRYVSDDISLCSGYPSIEDGLRFNLALKGDYGTVGL